MNTGKLKCYELYALLLTCCWEIFKLLFTLFIAPFVLFVYQRQHEKISAPVKCAALTRSFSDTYQRVNENRTKHFPWSNLYMVPVVLRCCIQWQNRSEVTSRGTEPFTLQRHKEELGKAYVRITLYLCKTTAIVDAFFFLIVLQWWKWCQFANLRRGMKILITTIDYSVIFRNEKALRGNKLI